MLVQVLKQSEYVKIDVVLSDRHNDCKKKEITWGAQGGDGGLKLQGIHTMMICFENRTILIQ